ncbi:MAG: TatD family hydrolase [Raoultibacter sp.]
MNFDEPLFADALFRKKGKKGAFKIVPSPELEADVADTHAHLGMLPDVPLNLARCALHRLQFICSITDPTEEADQTYEKLEEWQSSAQNLLPLVIKNTLAELGSQSSASQPFMDTLAQLDESEQHSVIDSLSIPHVRVSCGCHPHNAEKFTPEIEQRLRYRLKDSKSCAVGEVGLDYHYDYSPRQTQREVFRRQIQLAHTAEMPLILHLREAHDDGLKIMDEEGFPTAGVLLHCFNLDFATLEPWLERGAYVAFGGPITFAKSDETRQAAKRAPQNRILTETDAPFMTPAPMRGMVCGPEHTVFTAARLAEVCGARPGEERRSFLQEIYGSALCLLDKELSSWQRAEMKA